MRVEYCKILRLHTAKSNKSRLAESKAGLFLSKSL